MFQQGIIVPSCSLWAFPFILMLPQFCVDFFRINEQNEGGEMDPESQLLMGFVKSFGLFPFQGHTFFFEEHSSHIPESAKSCAAKWPWRLLHSLTG